MRTLWILSYYADFFPLNKNREKNYIIFFSWFFFCTDLLKKCSFLVTYCFGTALFKNLLLILLLVFPKCIVHQMIFQKQIFSKTEVKLTSRMLSSFLFDIFTSQIIKLLKNFDEYNIKYIVHVVKKWHEIYM